MGSLSMDLISFDRKAGPSSGHPDLNPDEKCEAVVYAGCVVVKDDVSSSLLQAAGFGHILGERQDRVNKDIFPQLPDDIEVNSAGLQWSEKRSKNSRVELSFEETAFLAFELRCLIVCQGSETLDDDHLWRFICSSASKNSITRCAVYRHLRRAGWCVRSGLTYGCHYLLYQEGPDVFHASAAVRIENFTPYVDYIAANRALSNVKKAFITASVSIPVDLTTDSYSCLDQIEVKTSTSVTMFPDRMMNEEMEKHMQS